MLFEKSFCSNSICGPSRAVILSGKHSHKNGFMNNGNSFDWNQQIFPKILRKNGYQTALYARATSRANRRGSTIGRAAGTRPLPQPGHDLRGWPAAPRRLLHRRGHRPAVNWLKEKRDEGKPFVMMVQHKAPHRNWMPALRHLGSMTSPSPSRRRCLTNGRTTPRRRGIRNWRSTGTWT